MKTITISSFFNDSYIGGDYNCYIQNIVLNFLNENFPYYEFKYVNCLEKYADVIFYKWDNLDICKDPNEMFSKPLGHPIFIYYRWSEHNSYPMPNNWGVDCLKIFTNNYQNYSVTMNADSEKNLYYPLVNFETIYNAIEKRQQYKFDFKQLKFASWVSSNDVYLRKRVINYISKNYSKIDYYGLVTDEWDNPDFGWQYYDKFIHKYKFNFAVENTFTKNSVKYITEKIEHAYVYNSVPIYKGCSNITDYFNENSFININDMSEDEAIKKIDIINNNEELYKEMFYAYPFKDKNINYSKIFEDRFVNFLKKIFNNI